MALEASKNYFAYYAGHALNWLLARRWIRRVVRVLDYYLVRNRMYSGYFEKYKPDTVFLAHLFDDHQAHFLREAKYRGVRSVGFVNSWDKLTARHSMRLLPDTLVVFNEIVKKEAIKHADMDGKNIIVTGLPHYDWHVNHKPIDRAVFCKNKGLDPKKKIISYAPMGKAFSNSDWDIIDLLHEATESGRIPNTQLFIRFQPNDFVENKELKERPYLKYDMPGVRFSAQRGVNWDMNFDDIRGLTDTLASTDLFICYASSMSVDAAVFDIPIININFEVREKELLAKSPTFFYHTEHYKNALNTGGISLPKNKNEFVTAINTYLKNPALHHNGRTNLVKQQCGKIDGRAGERIARHILD